MKCCLNCDWWFEEDEHNYRFCSVECWAMFTQRKREYTSIYSQPKTVDGVIAKAIGEWPEIFRDILLEDSEWFYRNPWDSEIERRYEYLMESDNS